MDNINLYKTINNIDGGSKHINNYFDNIDIYTTDLFNILVKIPKYNLVIYTLIIFIIFNFTTRFNIKINHIFAIIISCSIIYFLLRYDYFSFINYTTTKKMELKFLNKLLFENTKWDTVNNSNITDPFKLFKKSYLYLNPVLVDLFYNIREYIQYNSFSYINSLIHCNNVIEFDFNSKNGLNNKYENYEIAINESKKAINELNSIIYKLPVSIETNKKFSDTINKLHGLLNTHIKNIANVFKDSNIVNEINIGSMPDNFYDEYFFIGANDTKTDDYNSIFNMY